MEYFLMFTVFIIALCLFLMIGLPVAVGMGMVGVLGAIIFISPNSVIQLSSIAFTHSGSFVLLVVPLFILMGEAIAASPIGNNLFSTAKLWLNRVPGSLAMGTVLGCTGFSAITGSSPVTAATIGSSAVPEMIKNGYSKKLALGATAAGGTLGILIPPSIPLIMFGVVTETSIRDLFIAGLIPGAMIALLICLYIFVLVKMNPGLAPKSETKSSFKVKVKSLGTVAPIILLSVIVIGSIYFGIATPTESGAVGALVALLIVGFMGYLNRARIKTIMDNTVKTTAMFFFLTIGGLFAAFVLNRLGIPQGMADFLVGLPVAPWMMMVLINILLIILGMFLDPLSILLIMAPILLPTAVQLGYDPVWFGIMMTINSEIGAITPPVGFNIFILKSVVPGVKLSEIISGSIWFIIPLLVGLALIIIFPEIVLFLPGYMN